MGTAQQNCAGEAISTMKSKPNNLLKMNNLAYVVGVPNGSARSIRI